jgi:hypothetical protein
MVINNALQLMSFLDGFDASKQEHHNILDEIVKKYPHFHLVQPYFLKSIEHHSPKKFDQMLSHTAIATYDRHLLYEFLETPEINTSKTVAKKETPKQEVKQEIIKTKTSKKKTKKEKQPRERKTENHKKISKELPFTEWVTYLRRNQSPEQYNQIDEKFELFDKFLEKKKRIKPQKQKTVMDDLSIKSLASTDELMTETLAKVFVKQKKFENALQAYQILSLKYPEKNSFFADQIKEIKRLQKLK